jgi:Flp pilus assembly pilin Flp
MKRFQNLEQLKNRMGSQVGQTMSEYGVALLVISASAVAAFGLLSNKVANLVNSVVGLLP